LSTPQNNSGNLTLVMTLNIRGTWQHSWLRHYATHQKVVGLIPNKVTGYFNGPNPSSCTTALRSTQPVTQMSTRKLPGCKGRPMRKADNLTTICKPTAEKMRESQHLTNLWTSMVCYRYSYTFLHWIYQWS
jgi:hypothetical protein